MKNWVKYMTLTVLLAFAMARGVNAQTAGDGKSDDKSPARSGWRVQSNRAAIGAYGKQGSYAFAKDQTGKTMDANVLDLGYSIDLARGNSPFVTRFGLNGGGVMSSTEKQGIETSGLDFYQLYKESDVYVGVLVGEEIKWNKFSIGPVVKAGYLNVCANDGTAPNAKTESGAYVRAGLGANLALIHIGRDLWLGLHLEGGATGATTNDRVSSYFLITISLNRGGRQN